MESQKRSFVNQSSQALLKCQYCRFIGAVGGEEVVVIQVIFTRLWSEEPIGGEIV